MYAHISMTDKTAKGIVAVLLGRVRPGDTYHENILSDAGKFTAEGHGDYEYESSYASGTRVWYTPAGERITCP